MTPKVPAGADLKRSETGVSEKNLRCISGTSAFRISRYQHYWRRKTTFLSLLRTFLVVERNPLLKNCGFARRPLNLFPAPCADLMSTYPLMNLPFSLRESGADFLYVTAAKRGTAVGLPQRFFRKIFAVHR